MVLFLLIILRVKGVFVCDSGNLQPKFCLAQTTP